MDVEWIIHDDSNGVGGVYLRLLRAVMFPKGDLVVCHYQRHTSTICIPGRVLNLDSDQGNEWQSAAAPKG